MPLKTIKYNEMKENHSDFILFKNEDEKIKCEAVLIKTVTSI